MQGFSRGELVPSLWLLRRGQLAARIFSSWNLLTDLASVCCWLLAKFTLHFVYFFPLLAWVYTEVMLCQLWFGINGYSQCWNFFFIEYIVTVSIKCRFWHAELLLLEFSAVATSTNLAQILPANVCSLFLSPMHALSPLQFRATVVFPSQRMTLLWLLAKGQHLSPRLLPHLQEWRFGPTDPLFLPVVLRNLTWSPVPVGGLVLKLQEV